MIFDDEDQKLEKKVDEILTKVKQKGRSGITHVLYGRTIVTFLLVFLQIAFYYFIVMQYYKNSVYFLMAFTGVSLLVVVFIINEQMNPMYKLSWIIPVVAVPIYGIPMYLLIRLQPRIYVMRRNLLKWWGKLTPYLKQKKDAVDSLCKESKDAFNTARYLNSTLHYPVYRNTSVEYFPSGETCFRKMLMELEKAEKFIFIEYFIIDRGIMWNAILEILKERVAHGVEVRVMYDGTCLVKLLPHSYEKQLKELGIKAKVFSPPVPAISIHQNNRDHRKIMVIDGKVAFTGGINLADEYINEIERFGHWKDTAVMLRGEGVKTFTCLFLQLWNLDVKKKSKFVQDGELRKYLFEYTFEGAGGFVIPYGDSPLDKENTGEQVYLDILNQAEKYVHIMTPYLILDNEMMMALKSAAKRGVEVKIIMPHIPDKKYAFHLARTYYPELLESGVKIYEYKPGFVHAKVFVSDNEKATVGSINLDYRSLFLHFECGVYMYGCDCINEIIQDFNSTLNECIEVTRQFYIDIPLRKKLFGRVMRLFAPIL